MYKLAELEETFSKSSMFIFQGRVELRFQFLEGRVSLKIGDWKVTTTF